MSIRKNSLLACLALSVMILAGIAMQAPQEPLHRFRVVLGLTDRQPTDWSGHVAVEGGEITALSGWRFEQGDVVTSKNAWKCRTRNQIAPTHRYPVLDHAGKPKGQAVFAPWPNGVHMTVQGAAATLALKLPAGTVEFAARDVRMGEPKSFLNGKVRIERLPDTVLVREAAPHKATDPVQDDYPAFWVHYKSGKQYLAWVAYHKEKDRVLLVEREGPNGSWSKPLEVAGPGQHFRVALATTHGGTLWIVWASQQHDGNRNISGNWDLFGRSYKEGQLGEVQRLTDRPGPDIWHRMTTDKHGRGWLVWQGFDGKRSAIFARCVDGDGWHEPIRVSQGGESNNWDPAIAADTKEDRVWVGWDSYQGDNYAIHVRSISAGANGKLGEVLRPQDAPFFQAHVSLACDSSGRLWAAWDESGPQWGKDTGFLYGGGAREDTTRLYASRTIRIKYLQNGLWLDPIDVNDVLTGTLKEYNELPRLETDTEGRIWLAFRHRVCRMPRADGWAATGGWHVFVTAFSGDRWLEPLEAPRSAGRLDMRISSQRDPDDNVYFAYAADNRGPPGFAPRNLHVAVSRFSAAPPSKRTEKMEVKREYKGVKPVHPKEADQVARIRNYKIEAGGKTYRIYRGDLHRHTDISGDGPGDGSLMDLHRYALDAAALDFIMVTDHNMGNDNEYCWWRTQQANDLYTVPGAFISMYGYERSVRYPNGHRNVIWPERGHRTLPLPKPIPAAMKKDTPRLYEYLRRTNGICTLHTSATDQGTDWADAHDPLLEPFVELFQGYHTSYEAPGAPKSVNDKSDMIHGPYKSDGFVSLALDKGYRLGFQASSDHISTHVSYACILAEEFSRKGLIDAMRRRHSYAATDNIVLDVRLGSHLMGDEVRTDRPRFDVVVLGTAPIDKVEILRNNAVVHTRLTTDETARFTWQDPLPLKGDKAAFYYVRVQQKDGNMGWSSPIWVTSP
jgi:hypothetical protein